MHEDLVVTVSHELEQVDVLGVQQLDDELDVDERGVVRKLSALGERRYMADGVLFLK